MDYPSRPHQRRLGGLGGTGVGPGARKRHQGHGKAIQRHLAAVEQADCEKRIAEITRQIMGSRRFGDEEARKAAIELLPKRVRQAKSTAE